MRYRNAGSREESCRRRSAKRSESCGRSVRSRFGERRLCAFLLAMSAWASTSCTEREPPRDPLRIPWEMPEALFGAVHASLSTGARSGATENVASDAGAKACLKGGCHEDLADSTRLHARVTVGSCVTCHVAAENADHTFLPVSGDGGVCRTCHPAVPAKTTVHDPFQNGDCLSCHDPHGGGGKGVLRGDDLAALCARCHESRHEPTLHGPYADGDCLACHEPHASDFEWLARGRPGDLCLQCHDRELESADGQRIVADIATLIRSSPFKHGPVRSGECGGCHAGHASPNPYLLRHAFPASFYLAYEESRYALCFQCHDRALALRERTTTLTGFRHGDLNLHYLHANREKGRSCRACHEIHASSQPFHLSESVPYGNWVLPIVYRQTENGGECLASCHQRAEYDRSAEGH